MYKIIKIIVTFGIVIALYNITHYVPENVWELGIEKLINISRVNGNIY